MQLQALMGVPGVRQVSRGTHSSDLDLHWLMIQESTLKVRHNVWRVAWHEMALICRQ